MRIVIPDFASKKDLFAYLKANKKALIAQKRAMPIVSEVTHYTPELISQSPISDTEIKRIASQTGVSEMAIKAAIQQTNSVNASLPDGVIRVRVVANAANFVDSHFDVLLNDAPKKSIKERKGLIPHLHDHIHMTTAEVGEVKSITLEMLPVNQLGYSGDAVTQCVVFTTDIKEEYNKAIYDRYKEGRAKQHSIGLQYVKIELCVNTDDKYYEEEKAAFDKYYPQILNKEVVDQKGYFWAISEYKLIENSVVLFGSNPYTPTLEAETNKGVPGAQPTHEEPDNKTTQQKAEIQEVLNRILNKTKN